VDTEWVSLFCRIIHAPLRARASVSLDETSALGHLDDIFGLLPRQKVLRSRGEDFISAIAGNKVVDIGGARNDWHGRTSTIPMAGSSDNVFSVILGGCGHRFLPSIIVSSAVKDFTSPTSAVLLDASSSSVFVVVFVFVIASIPEHSSTTSPSDMVLDLDPQTAQGRLVLLSESDVKVYNTSLPHSSEQLLDASIRLASD
jgi:hypothetical protein